MKKAVIFDLDGTLVDSIQDIANATNHALAQLGYDPFTVQEYNSLAGGGNKKLLKSALRIRMPNDQQPDENLIQKAVDLKVAFENTPSGHSQTKPFPAIHEMLKTLQTQGIQLAVLSNKTEHRVLATVNQIFPDIRWKHVAGARHDTPLKPDPTAALAILTNHMSDIQPTDCIFVGDTDVDMKTGLAAGMSSVGVPWGFRTAQHLTENGATIVVTTPQQIVDFVNSP